MATQSIETPEQELSLNDFVPSPQIPKLYPHLFTKNQWTWLTVNRATNGLGPCFKQVGKRLFVNIKTLAECIEAQQAVA